MADETDLELKATNRKFFPPHWSACRVCSTTIVVYIHPKEEPYKLWVCARCAAAAWLARQVFH